MHILYCSRRKLRLLLVLISLVLLTILVACVWPHELAAMVGGEQRLVPIYEVDTPHPALSISFDASWGAEHTVAILDTLDEYGVKATFFLVNIWLADYPEMAQEIALRGHEIGLHSTTHPHFTELSGEQMAQELQENAALITEITGQQPLLFRPPFGDYDNRLIECCRELGYTPIQWSVDSLDWKDLSAEEIANRVLKDIGAGDIVLFHNNGLHTAEALPVILEELQGKGLAIVPISELLLTGDCYVDGNGVQKQR